ncbi:hypothetical protein LBMAG27_20820 [Bacteroidota bacterium]|nr:hypothetical protein LBMAG27_20820 [Bacteroidota bacterium]
MSGERTRGKAGLIYGIALLASILASGVVKTRTEKKLPKKQLLFKEFVSYYEKPYSKKGYENLKVFYYGLYLNLPNDTTGIANEMVEYLKQKKYNDGDVIHVWVFTDSTIIPKSFSGDWSTPKSRSKCFAHIGRLSNGNISYDYDMLGEFKR